MTLLLPFCQPFDQEIYRSPDAEIAPNDLTKTYLSSILKGYASVVEWQTLQT